MDNKTKKVTLQITGILLAPILLVVVWKIYSTLIKFMTGCSDLCFGDMVSAFATVGTIVGIGMLIIYHYPDLWEK